MPESGMLELAKELLVKSRDEKVQWRPRSPGQFVTEIPDMSLIIAALSGGDYILRLMNKDGSVLESLYGDRGTTERDILREIYELARRRALNVDDSIDKALQYLKRE